eukprot:TRINITY_DN101458_c0_g1_i1.p1 TRINITY_DN101458_c0_g1~~TRINITY_DN101458_c0_g1_i1.p1  ORF type:complete len:463 (-),score=23.73 TRINITY_DN101458_c0_g1_i1:9-1397(-)
MLVQGQRWHPALATPLQSLALTTPRTTRSTPSPPSLAIRGAKATIAVCSPLLAIVAWRRCGRRRHRLLRRNQAQGEDGQGSQESRRGFATPLSFWSSEGVRFQREYTRQSGISETAKVERYDAEYLFRGPGYFTALFSDARLGTIFNQQLLLRAVILVALAIGVTVALRESAVSVAQLQRSVKEIANLADFVSTSLSFLLAFFLGTAVNRWWIMRDECIGGLWGAIDDLCMWAGAWLSEGSERDEYARQLIRRYGVVSHALIYKQARNEDMLDDLVSAGLLLPAEAQELQGRPSRAQVVWAWLTKFWQELIDEGRIPQPESYCVIVMNKLAAGRGAIGRAFAYTDTQLPYAYCQLLATVSNAALLLNAVAAGAQAADNLQPDIIDATGIIRLLIFLVIFDGLLELLCQVENPFSGGDCMDFPALSFQKYMLDETSALMESPKSFQRGSTATGWWSRAFQKTR